MPPVQKYDWSSAEQMYIQAQDRYPHINLKDISVQHNIPYQTVRRYAAKHRWVSRRDTIHYDARKLQQPVRRQHYYSTQGMHKNVTHMLQTLIIPNI